MVQTERLLTFWMISNKPLFNRIVFWGRIHIILFKINMSGGDIWLESVDECFEGESILFNFSKRKIWWDEAMHEGDTWLEGVDRKLYIECL